jgi:hypothetical protein
LSHADQQAVRTDAKERDIAYAFFRQSGAQHANLKMDLQNDYTKGDNRHPKNPQQTLQLLDKCTKTNVPKATQSEGASFAQTAGKGKSSKATSRRKYSAAGKVKTFDKEYWKDKKCFKSDKTGHPSRHCLNADEISYQTGEKCQEASKGSEKYEEGVCADERNHGGI